jgi:hypothetical protein
LTKNLPLVLEFRERVFVLLSTTAATTIFKPTFRRYGDGFMGKSMEDFNSLEFREKVDGLLSTIDLQLIRPIRCANVLFDRSNLLQIDFIHSSSLLRSTSHNIYQKHSGIRTWCQIGNFAHTLPHCALVLAGLVALEIQKFPHTQLARESFVNLQLGNMIFMSETQMVRKRHMIDGELPMSDWDAMELYGDCSLQFLVERIETRFHMPVYSIFSNNKIIYSSWAENSEHVARNLSELLLNGKKKDQLYALQHWVVKVTT